MRIAGIYNNSLVNGEGSRMVIFTQGCKHNCPGCFNPETHDFNGGQEVPLEEIMKKVKANCETGLIDGITFSGGDPMEHPLELEPIAKLVHSYGLTVWSFTGYTYEKILESESKRRLLENLDVLIDGKFDQTKCEEGLKFRGSSNQRIIDVQKSLKENTVVLYEFK